MVGTTCELCLESDRAAAECGLAPANQGSHLRSTNLRNRGLSMPGWFQLGLEPVARQQADLKQTGRNRCATPGTMAQCYNTTLDFLFTVVLTIRCTIFLMLNNR